MIPTVRKDHLDNLSFTANLRYRLGLEQIGMPKRCKCGAIMDSLGHHLLVCRQVNRAGQRHDAMRDLWMEMFRSMGENPLLEPQGLIEDWPNMRPADIGLTAQTFGTQKLLALDMSVTWSDSFTKEKAMNSEPLKLAGEKEEEKKRLDVQKNRSANGNLIQAKYTKIPIVYEATGAIGKEAKDMMKKVMLKLRDQHPSGIPTPSQVGLESHWGATSFKSHWTQKFATHLAKHRSKVVQEIRFARKTKEWGLGRQHS